VTLSAFVVVKSAVAIQFGPAPQKLFLKVGECKNLWTLTVNPQKNIRSVQPISTEISVADKRHANFIKSEATGACSVSLSEIWSLILREEPSCNIRR